MRKRERSTSVSGRKRRWPIYIWGAYTVLGVFQCVLGYMAGSSVQLWLGVCQVVVGLSGCILVGYLGY